MTVIQQWHILELSFHAEKAYPNPYLDGKIDVVFTSPDGRQVTAPGFWDGGTVWKVRFAPSLAGLWTWESTACSSDTGLHGKRGSFSVDTYNGKNPVYRHGFLKVTENGRGFAHDDGTPFFWLGDTVWSVSAKATTEEWKEYIAYRSVQGFNIAQINALPQHDASHGAVNRMPFPREDRLVHWDRPDPAYFQYLDQLMDITVQAGMFTAMVALWFDFVPGSNLSWNYAHKKGLTPELAAVYGRYLAARYAAYGTAWLVTGDSDFTEGEASKLYDAAAYAIKEATPYPALLTAHLYGSLSTPENLNERKWLTFHMYQSGHGKNTIQASLDCASKDRAYSPARPVLNGEPCYEEIGYWNLPERVSRDIVREVAWKSILGGGNAGITYGAHGLWSWHCEGDVFPWADTWQMPAVWQKALQFEGAEDLVRMKRFFEDLPWWELEPANGVLGDQSGPGCIAAADVECRHIIVYVPAGSKVCINNTAGEAYSGVWHDPCNRENKQEIPCFQKCKPEVLSSPWEKDSILLLCKN